MVSEYGVKMVEKQSIIEIVDGSEELPSDARRKILRISALTDDDKDRVKELMNKLDLLISKSDETQTLNSIIELKGKLTQIMIYVSKLEEKIDMIPMDKSTHKIEYVKDEIKDDIAVLSNELQSSKRSFLTKLEELKESVSDVGIDMAAIDDINATVSDIKEDMKTAVSESLSSTGYDIKTSMSDISDNIKDSVSLVGGDIKTSMLEMREDFRQSLSEISTRFYEIEASINNKIGEIKDFLQQGSDNIEQTLSTLYVIRDVINKSNDNIELSVENLRNITSNVNEKVDSLSNFVENVDSARIQLEENVNAMHATRSDVHDFVTNVDKKTDDVLNVVYGKVGELGTVKEALKKNVAKLTKSAKNIAGTSTKLEDSITLLDDLKSSHKKAEKDMKNAAKGVTKTARDIRQNDKDIKKTLTSMKTIERESRKKEAINRDLTKELKRFNIHLSKLDEAEFFYRILMIKKRIKQYKRLPRWAIERRDLLFKSIVLFEDELVDLSVIYALTKGDANHAGLKRMTGFGESALRRSLKKLLDEGRIGKYRKGRSVFYTIIV